MSDALVLHWPLDAVAPQDAILDSGPNDVKGACRGVPAVVTDPKFACLRFTGRQYLIVPAGHPKLALGTYTVSAWVRWPGGNGTYGVFGKQSPNLRLRVEPSGRLEHLWRGASGELDSVSTGTGALAPDVWRHLAITHDGSRARILIDGEVVAERAARGHATDTEEFWAAGGNGCSNFEGLLAQFRVYDRALSPAEVQRDMADDEPPLEQFVRSHPLDFALLNVDAQPVLYIDDLRPQTLTLRLTNSSRATVEAVPLTGVSSSTYHFALRLRPGTLAAGLTPTVTTAGWALAAAPDGTALYLQWKDPKPLPAGAAIAIDLAGLNADGTEGTHGTQVELEHRNVRYAGQSAPLEGSRVQYLDVVNHRGRYDIPLDIRFVNGDRVLSDGVTPNRLVLHIANTMRTGAGIPLRTGAVASTFRVSFDAEADADDKTPWALTKVGAAGGVAINATGTRWLARRASDRVRTWEIVPAADTVLAPGEVIELTLTGIVALPRAGHAPVLVEYVNIPGYADGSQTAMVDRTPLLFTQSSAGVGIAASALEARFQVVHTPQNANGDALVLGRKSAPNLRLGYDTTYTWIQSHGSSPLAINPMGNHVAIGGTAPEGRLHILNDQQDATGNTLILGPTGRTHLRAGYHRDYGWLQSGSGPLLVNPRAENVGIGPVPSPKGKLHVLGTESDSLGGALWVGPADGAHLRFGHHRDYSWIQSGGAKPLLINPLGVDRVGIGTPGPLGAKVTIGYRERDGHLQLRRDTAFGAAGEILYLELYQENTAGSEVTYPSLRFHHASKFWHRIEGRPEGFFFKDGNIPSNTLIDVFARKVTATQVVIDGVTIGQREARVLQRLADGQLEFDLLNTYQGEYMYAANYEPRDNDRRYVYTWRRRNRVAEGRWRLTDPS
ncbi:LamG-like jellyroll fold domain-containing protein [Actinomadura flavalba]|uniref:LamG-like jellyroll fold domain-containing protein n=1 Tax=Actinomadura flavalba TaxID=1120938 RepID=UPI00035D1B06|nr:LamG-like jellyroll fold domain-containing protein [Actinomadura flavalba]